MSSIPVPDEQTRYSSRRRDNVDALAWPVFSVHAMHLLRSAGEVLRPKPAGSATGARSAVGCELTLSELSARVRH